MTALVPALRSARVKPRSSTCRNNLRQLALAMHTYHEVYDTLPPAYIADENGQPMHSWRVLILPMIERPEIHERYDFSKPWDHPVNQEVVQAEKIPVFRCPANSGASDTTSYFVVVGNETMFPPDEAVRMSDVSDGLSNTLLVIEFPGQAVHWAEPKDLTLDEILARLPHLQLAHPGGLNVAFADGSVQFISASDLYELLVPLSTRAGGEQTSPAF